MLINFKPANYLEHMSRWASWRAHTGSAAARGSGPLSGAAGTYVGGKENILRQKQYTARGKQTRSNAHGPHLPEGHDTEMAIEIVVRQIRVDNPDAARALEARFCSRLGNEENAERLGVSLATFRNHLADGKKLVITGVRCLRVGKRVASDPGAA